MCWKKEEEKVSATSGFRSRTKGRRNTQRGLSLGKEELLSGNNSRNAHHLVDVDLVPSAQW